jgi:hypothetical protein
LNTNNVAGDGGKAGPKKNVRIRELERVIADRYGAALSDDDAGMDDLFIMANHLAHLDAPDRRILAWVRRWAPWHGDDKTAALIEAVLRKPLKWTADRLAQRLGLDYATRTRLAITTIGAVDCKKAKRVKLRRKRDAARQKARRATAGAAPHAASAARTKPWEALGISRRTYYRNRRNGTVGTNSSAAYPTDIVVYAKQCQGAPPPPGGGSWARAVADTDRVFMTPRETERKIETALHASCFGIMRRAPKNGKNGNGATSDHRNGQAARRPDNQPQQNRETAMTNANDDTFEKFFQLLLSNYPRRDAADEARAALRDVFARADDPGQVRVLLLDGIESYEAETRATGKTNFWRLDDFIRSEIWAAENLPFNLAQAA